MGLELDYPAGATPLDPDEAAGLIPGQITTQGELNEWEQQNILEGRQWAFGRKHNDVLSPEFARALHKRMFGKTWKWAGRFRATEKNIGMDPRQVAVELKKLCDDTKTQIEHKAYPLDEIAVRFHHRLTQIHSFPNGNGRHARLIVDVLLTRNGAEPFTWGAGEIVAASDVRDRYIAALRAADQRRDYGPLLEFVRSTG